MKTLYTGHVTVDNHYVYSFIYADTLLEAEEHLTTLLERYVRERHSTSTSLAPPMIQVVSRPNGWDPPDGYYLPGTSRQYALRYPSHSSTNLQNTGAHSSDRADASVEDTGAMSLSKESRATI